ncbi:MAG: hypothetical protein JXJ22_14345 [Bacteroidales bacterium]|nr:hypothetical protein [Bacteroidales bacterium]
MKRFFALFILTIFVIACENLFIEENIQNTNVEDFEYAWSTIDEIYPLFEFKKINWDSIYNIYKTETEESQGDEIYTVLFHMLKELKDGHAIIYTRGGWPVTTYKSTRSEKDKNSYNPLVVRNYFDKELKVACGNNLEYEYLTPEIGYIYISTFGEGSWKSGFDDVLNYFSDSKGLIIDVRNNPGGYNSTYHYILARFIKNQIVDTMFYKEEKQVYTINPYYSNLYLKPIVVLINGTSSSAAEKFPSLMKFESNVTLIGDTTAGLGGGTYQFDLPSGKKIKIISLYYKNFNNKMIEWNGVAPDIRVEQTEMDIKNGIDHQLEFARNYLENIIEM